MTSDNPAELTEPGIPEPKNPDGAAEANVVAPLPRRLSGVADPAALTRRELAVLRLVAAGLTNKQVGTQLGRSVHTVEAQLHSVYYKLKVTTRGAAIRFAIDHDLV